MKCEKCGKNEATCFYRENINGQKREMHLCADCAREEGVFAPMERRSSDLFDLFFSSFGLPAWEDRFFRPVMSFPQPRRRAVAGQSTPGDTKGGEGAVNEQLRQRRERNMLRAQLNEAVEREDYETAITLRDRLSAMEKGEEQ